jgi:hypothetical protein
LGRGLVGHRSRGELHAIDPGEPMDTRTIAILALVIAVVLVLFLVL